MIETDDDIVVLAFEIDACRFAVTLESVHRVAPSVAITPLPKAPAIVDGLIDVRGRIAPVLDLRTRFGLPAKPPGADEHLIVAVAGRRMVALRADRALDVLRIPPERIGDIEDVVANTDYIAGVARLDDGLVLIHDLETFLSQSEAQTIDAAVDAARDIGAGGGGAV